MFIGHLPAGYLLTKKLQQVFSIPTCLMAGLLGSILPDFDMVYFYLIDKQQHLHHGYWTHIPFFWMLVAGAVYSLLYFGRQMQFVFVAHVFFASIFAHLFLDTIVGKIEWLQPFSDRAIYFFDVPAVYDFWVWNFVLHWTFLFEVTLVFAAVLVLTLNLTRCRGANSVVSQ